MNLAKQLPNAIVAIVTETARRAEPSDTSGGMLADGTKAMINDMSEE